MLAQTVPREDELLQLIKDVGALLYGDFTLSSLKPSNYYFDSKPLTLDPKGAYVVGNYFFEKLKATDAKAIGGMELGAIPIVSAVTLLSHQHQQPLPAFYVRKEPKQHGTQSLIEGNFPKDDDSLAPVAILDDVVTGGGSILQAIDAVEAEGNPIVAVMCILDRNEGGRERLMKRGDNLQAMFTMVNGRMRFNLEAD